MRNFKYGVSLANAMVEISNPKLAELDKKIGEFYKLNARYMGSIANLHGKQVYKTEFSRLMKEAEAIQPESEFDALLLRNIKSNLKLSDVTIDFLTNSDFSLPVKDFIELIAGEGAWAYLEEKMRNPLWEKQWNYSEKTQERSYSQVSSFIEEAQTAARACLPKIKEDMLNYGKSEGYLPADFDMNILLLPPNNGAQYSSWNSKAKIFNMGSYCFEFFIKNRGVIAVPTQAYNTAFHEILGHGAHQIFSEKLPYSVRFTEEIGTITPTKSITEGVAINNEKESFAFLRKNLKNMNLTEDDIQLLEDSDALAQESIYNAMYCALIKDRELREKGFDGYEHILKLTKNPIIARGFKYDFKQDFRDNWRHFGHTFGPMHYKRMLERVKQEFGEEYLTKEKKRFNEATLSGVWSWEVYPDAVIYFLKNKA